MKHLQLYVAEFVGTFVLVFAGPGAAVVDRYAGAGLGALGVGLCFGLVVGAMIFALGHISGAHINPAVTIAFAAARHFPLRLVPGYLVAQLAGAAAAGGLLALLFGDAVASGATVPKYGAAQAFILELVLSAILMLVIVSVATDVRAQGQLAALAIGGYVALAATFAGPIAGASMNPARSFGPALAANVWQDQWVYWVGPVLGTLAGGFLYRYLAGGDHVASREEGPDR